MARGVIAANDRFVPARRRGCQTLGPMTRLRNDVDKVRVLPPSAKAVSPVCCQVTAHWPTKNLRPSTVQKACHTPHLPTSTLLGWLTYTQYRACSLHPELIDSSLTRHSSSHMGMMSPRSTRCNQVVCSLPRGPPTGSAQASRFRRWWVGWRR